MNAIERFTVDTVVAISRLVKENLYVQALVLLYSAIDTIAWANLPDGDVSQKDFIAWVNKYVKPDDKFACTADDLYGARCGLLHSSAAESKKSRKGEASEIWYATSPDSIIVLREYASKKTIVQGLFISLICWKHLLLLRRTFVRKSPQMRQDSNP